MSSRLITAQELLQAPTGIDWGTVGESGVSASLQAIEQSNIIDRASLWIANYCTQRLDCTTDTEQAILGGSYTKAWVDRNGYLWYRTDFFPILTISAMSWAVAGSGSAPGSFISLDISKLLTFGEFNRVNRVADFSQDWQFLEYGPGIIKITYVNGYPNMVTTASMPTPGLHKSITVDTTLGLSTLDNAIGQTLTIYNGAKTEVITVESITDATHFVADQIVNDHSTDPIGIGISAIPADVKEACILTCMHFARQRGVEAFVMGGGGGGAQSSPLEAIGEAEYLLQPYKRIL